MNTEPEQPVQSPADTVEQPAPTIRVEKKGAEVWLWVDYHVDGHDEQLITLTYESECGLFATLAEAVEALRPEVTP